MTEVLLACDGAGRLRRCSASGHSGFAKKGADIVCAGISAVLGACVESLSHSGEISLRVEKPARGILGFEVVDSSQTERADERLRCAADFIRGGIGGISDEYPEYSRLKEISEL